MNMRFNLQPWRDQLRAKKQKNFIYVTCAVVGLLVALLGANYFLEKKYIESQKEAEAYLQQKVDALKIVQKEVEETQKLIAKINEQITAIEILQAQRGVALKLMDHLAKYTPETVFLDAVNFDGNQLSIDGVAENDSSVAEFMRSLERSELLGTPVLRVIKAARSTNRYTIPDSAEVKLFTVVVDLLPSYKDI